MTHSEWLLVEEGQRNTVQPSHRLALFPDSSALFRLLEERIRRATRRVWLETYIYRDDALGRRFGGAFEGAARRGVEVRLLYDANGSRGASATFFRALREWGVDARPFRPSSVMWQRLRFAPRDHGRVVIVDDAAFTGGLNWGNEWVSEAEGGEGWHDVAVGVEGPCVADFERIFRIRWDEAGGSRAGFADYSTHGRYAGIELIADAPNRTPLLLRRLEAAVRAARRRVWIENSYCAPPRSLLDALYAAAARGIEVRLVLPAQSDLPSIQAVARGEYAAWLRRGLHVHEYQPAVLHSKFALVDDDWSMVGTYNANTIGLRFANETNLIVTERRFVAELAAVFARDLAQCHAVSLESTQARRWSVRLHQAALAKTYRAAEWVMSQGEPRSRAKEEQRGRP